MVFRDTGGVSLQCPSALLLRITRLAEEDFEAALLLAAELECALADLAHPAEQLAVNLTDALAARFRQNNSDLKPAIARLSECELPATLRVKTPEGFAFYGMSLRQFLNATDSPVADAAMVGIRSAGVSLAAVCARSGTRITVRPTGHPYDRELTLSAMQRQWVRSQLGQRQKFLIVDEGPGLSGSSFLATADALERFGVPATRILLIGNNAVDPDKLVAREAPHRWRRFQFSVVDPSEPPEGTRPFVRHDWRVEWMGDHESWPATWSQLTPPKALSLDGKVLWKYEGQGSFGAAAYERAQRLADAGFSPEIVGRHGGYTGYRTISGKRIHAGDLSGAVIDRLAEYCAFRQASFPSAFADPAGLEAAIKHNLRQMLGEIPDGFSLELARQTICDNRMMPHEWILSVGQLFKTDGVLHGDDHFFPGPCDIAWDIAGAIIEWEMKEHAVKRFLQVYEAQSGEHVTSRLGNYLVAYSVSRWAFSTMTRAGISAVAEKERFAADIERYGRATNKYLTEVANRSAAIA